MTFEIAALALAAICWFLSGAWIDGLIFMWLAIIVFKIDQMDKQINGK